MKAQVETDCVHVEKKVFFFPLKKKIVVFFFSLLVWKQQHPAKCHGAGEVYRKVN